MGTLVKFELKKLFNKKMNIIVIIVCLFLITLLFSMAGKDFLAIDKSGKSYKGKEAISVRKEQMKEISDEYNCGWTTVVFQALMTYCAIMAKEVLGEDALTKRVK